MALKKLDLNAKCPKCGNEDVSVYYHDGYFVGRTSACEFGSDVNRKEHMHRVCKRCHFEWLEACLGAEDAIE